MSKLKNINDVKSFGHQAWNFIKHIWQSFAADSCQTTAAALTYQTLFAVVPLLTVVYVILDVFKAFAGLREKVEALIFNNVIPENVIVIQDYLQEFSSQARNLSGASFALVGITAFLMLFTIERTFNEIWKIKEPRHGFQRFLMYWAVLTLGPTLALMGIVISSYEMTTYLLTEVTQTVRIPQFVPLFLLSGMFTLFYSVIPNCDVPFKHALIGGVLVALIFEIAIFVFPAVMSQSSIEVIYGTFAAVPLFLLWVYVSWTIVLLGAEFVKSLGIYRFGGSHQIEERLFQIIFLLEIFYRAHQRGDVVKEREIRQYASRINLEEWTLYKAELIQLNLIRVVERGGLVLSKDLNEISVWDLYTQLPWKLPTIVKGDKGWEKKLSERFTDLFHGNKASLDGDLETLFKEN